ncbi:MAG: DUF302 domain-containing protein [Chitinispirillales bacterium]|jgi:uncharacterized protein (DUF302 family)|nr:DUF302 domain-containing protein [Chitinispirillales bacterium]
MFSYGLTQELPFSFDMVITELRRELEKRGFEILSVNSIDEPFNELLDITFKRYTIISAAILPLAYRALVMNENFGVMLPCNIAVYEKEEKIVISAIKPTMFTHVIENGFLTNSLMMIERKLQEVFSAFERKSAKIIRNRDREVISC